MVFVGSFQMFAQYGTAPNNYYPDNYSGSIFSGVVVNTEADRIALEYKKGKKMETFNGRFEAGCSIHMPDRSERKITASNIPTGSSLTVYFNTVTKKIEQQKVQENLIIAVVFDEVNGQRVAEGKKLLHPCSNSAFARFKAFSR